MGEISRFPIMISKLHPENVMVQCILVKETLSLDKSWIYALSISFPSNMSAISQSQVVIPTQ